MKNERNKFGEEEKKQLHDISRREMQARRRNWSATTRPPKQHTREKQRASSPAASKAASRKTQASCKQQGGEGEVRGSKGQRQGKKQGWPIMRGFVKQPCDPVTLLHFVQGNVLKCILRPIWHINFSRR